MTEAQLQQAKEAADQFMARCDVNNDGVVEFSEVCEKFGADWDEEKKSAELARFKEMDTNGDGKVDKAEFQAWVLKFMTGQWVLCRSHNQVKVN